MVLTKKPGSIAPSVLAAVSGALGNPQPPVLLHRPYLPPTAWQYVKDCLDTGWVSSAGAYVSEFEQTLAATTGCQHAVATVNGTAALQVCLHLAGVKPGDEVICPSLTFVATANAIAHCGAIPHFVDVTESRLSIDPELLQRHLATIARIGGDRPVNTQSGRRIAGVCVMHCFGHPAELNPLLDVCQHYDLPLIEDAAESLGSYYQERHTGRFGQLSAVSFNGNKILTTGGGGAILTDDEALAARARHLTTTAKTPHAWEFYHDTVAWNYRLPNINAALGLAQLEVLPAILTAKRAVAASYENAFSPLKGIAFLAQPADSRSNYWLNNILLDRSLQSARDEVLQELNSAGYQARPIWQPMHTLPMHAHCPRTSLAVTESLSRRCISLPSSADLASGWSAIQTGRWSS